MSAHRLAEPSRVSDERPGVADQVAMIRAKVQRCGEIVVGPAELIFLSADMTANEALQGISQIAEWERWTFEYLPDGSVRFSSLEPAPNADGTKPNPPTAQLFGMRRTAE